MANDKQVQIAAAQLEETLLCLIALVDQTKTDTPEQKEIVIRANRAITGITTLLRSTLGPGNFSGGETGQFRLDPTQSQFL